MVRLVTLKCRSTDYMISELVRVVSLKTSASVLNQFMSLRSVTSMDHHLDALCLFEIGRHRL